MIRAINKVNACTSIGNKIVEIDIYHQCNGEIVENLPEFSFIDHSNVILKKPISYYCKKCFVKFSQKELDDLIDNIFTEFSRMEYKEYV